MIWPWVRNWLERRATIGELRRMRQQDESALMDQRQNPLNLALLAAQAGDQSEAAARWEDALERLPNAVVRSWDSLEVLLKLKRYDEAEALMRARHKAMPGDRRWLVGLAAAAEERGDMEEALKRWNAVRRQVPDTVEGFHGAARCLADLGRVHEAEVELNRALRRDPSDIQTRVNLARLADRRNDWPRSLERWRDLADHHGDPTAFAFGARAMIELGRSEEAEAWLAGPSGRYSDIEIGIVYAELAQKRGDLPEAAARWLSVRAIRPSYELAYLHEIECWSGANRQDDLDAVLRAAMARFPDAVWPMRRFAQAAHDRADWPEAVARWEAFRTRFPDEPEGWALGADALRASGQAAAAEALRR